MGPGFKRAHQVAFVLVPGFSLSEELSSCSGGIVQKCDTVTRSGVSFCPFHAPAAAEWLQGSEGHSPRIYLLQLQVTEDLLSEVL